MKYDVSDILMDQNGIFRYMKCREGRARLSTYGPMRSNKKPLFGNGFSLLNCSCVNSSSISRSCVNRSWLNNHCVSSFSCLCRLRTAESKR